MVNIGMSKISTQNTNETSAAGVPGRWMDGAIVYQIYPRSFQDSNGDGVGDIPGIISRLDYLKDLGVTAIWLSPFYPSPMADFGYDIADYRGVDPIFGTLEDFKELLQEAHSRSIRVMVDLVPNHTSDEHKWFRESRSSRNNPKADWYIWKDPKATPPDGTPQPPNNWLDVLTGASAWQWDNARQQFYLHSFHAKQPDLNWQNPAVRAAVHDVMRFWLDLGVDGFRVDAVYWLAKNPEFTDDPPVHPVYVKAGHTNYHTLRHDNSMGWPEVYAYLSEMAEVLKEPAYQNSPRFMVTEAYPEGKNSLEAYMAFYQGVDPAVAAPFNFDGLVLPWQAGTWRRSLASFHAALATCGPQAMACYAFGNHDQHRLASRWPEVAARGIAVMQCTLPGMTFVYYGEEIGMHNVDIPADRIQDPATMGGATEGGGRDPERTPMQWSADQNAGFSTATQTWLPVADDYRTNNVALQAQNPYSFLRLYKKLIRMRQECDVLRYGDFEVLPMASPHVLGYVRNFGGKRRVTLINFSPEPAVCEPGLELRRCLVSSDPRSRLTELSASSASVELLSFEAAFFEAA